MSDRYQLSDRRELYRGRIVNLTVDSIKTASGIETIREVFHHPGGAAVIPVLDNGDVLLVRQFRYPIQHELLEFPAGRIDPGETPESAAARELQEEVQMSAGTLEKVAEFYTTPGFCDEKIFLYLATALSPIDKSGDHDEELEVERLSLSTLKQMLHNGQILDAKTIIGINLLLLRSEKVSAERRQSI
ncbi:MAG: NUDIX hydrolase [Acidobacteriota bacterium]